MPYDSKCNSLTKLECRRKKNCRNGNLTVWENTGLPRKKKPYNYSQTPGHLFSLSSTTNNCFPITQWERILKLIMEKKMFSAFLFLPYVFYSAHVRFIMKWCLKRKCLIIIQSSRKKHGKLTNLLQHILPKHKGKRSHESSTKPRTNSSLRIEQIFGSRNTMCLPINQNLFNKKSYLPPDWLSRKWEVWLNFRRMYRC